MNSIKDDLKTALDRRAEAARIDDGLDAILSGEPVVRLTRADALLSRRRGALTAAAAAIAVVGAGGLIWANRTPNEPPATADGTELAPPVETNTDQVVASSVVHLKLADDGWMLVFADTASPALNIESADGSWTTTQTDVASNFSSYTPVAGYADDEVRPAVLFSTSGVPAGAGIDGLSSASQVTVAGIEATMLSDDTDTLHAIAVDLPSGARSTIVLENMTASEARSLVTQIEFLNRDEWLKVASEQPTETTIVVPADE